MTLQEYLDYRWNRLTPRAREIFNLPADQTGMMFTQALWTKQYYEELISGLQKQTT